MGINPNELFSSFSGVATSVGGFFKKGRSAKPDSGGRYESIFADLVAGYPSDILSPNSEVNRAIQFQAIEYNWKSGSIKDSKPGNQQQVVTPAWSCFLPIPQISFSENHSYEDFQAFGLGQGLESIRDVASKVSNFKPGEGAMAQIGSIASSAADVVAPIAVRGAYNILKSTLGEEMNVVRRNLANGVTVNPLTSTIYMNSALRTFTFSFNLIARDKNESEIIDRIIKNFQTYSRPSSGRATASGESIGLGGIDVHLDYLSHPYLWKIGFVGYGTDQDSDISKYLPKLKICAMESINVNFKGGERGSPLFFRSTGAPVEQEITMTFKELYMNTAEDM